jgi:hypothetical protein
MGSQSTSTRVLHPHKLSYFNFFIFEFALHFGMPDYFQPTSTDHMVLAELKAELFVWMEANPGVLFKVGGKKLSSNRHHGATHYDRKYFDTDSAYIFSGTLIDSRQAGWIELMLIQYAYSLELGVNDNRSSANNMATLPGSPYNYAEPGCVYL